MKSNIVFFTLFIAISFFLSGCQTKPQIPENTVGSFNFVKEKGNKRGIEIFDVNGNKVPLTNKDVPAHSRPAGSITIEFFSGSCTTRVCKPGLGCQTVILDPVNDCPE